MQLKTSSLQQSALNNFDIIKLIFAIEIVIEIENYVS